MSQQYRPSPAGVGSSGTASHMSPNFGAARPTQMYTSTQATYCFNPSQHPQFIASPVVYPSPLPNSQSGISLVSVPSALQSLYPSVPYDQRRGDLPNNRVGNPAGLQKVPSSAPLKTQEDQRKMEKERNFQLQQQRLKQFTVAGKKGSLNAENLIDSIFGKTQPKKETQKILKSENVNQEVKNHVAPVYESSKNVLPPSFTQLPFHSSPKAVVSSVVEENMCKSKSDPKVLESMMLECSNLTGPQKARTFQKPVVRELPPSSQQSVSFSSSVKARDWSNLQGLDEAFLIPKPRFPSWCHKDHILPLYQLVEVIVTSKGSHPPETNLLYPILMSSGLPREVLGFIWGIVNQTSPGHLTHDEMYAALALVAVAQSGHQIKNVDVLHELPKCPLPVLQCFNQQRPSSTPDTPLPATTDESNRTPVNSQDSMLPPSSNAEGFTVLNHFSNTTTPSPIRPSAITIQSSALTSEALKHRVEDNTSLPSVTPSDAGASSNEDDFDDFKSATPTAVGALSIAMSTSSMEPFDVTIVDDDEFGDFKQALGTTMSESFADFSSVEVKQSALVKDMSNVACEQDLISPDEDKYSVFRMLERTEKIKVEEQTATQNNEINLFECSGGNIFPASNESIPGGVTTFKNANESKASDYNSTLKTNDQIFVAPELRKQDDDFGDFLHAESSAGNIPTVSQKPDTFVCNFEANFADFSKLNMNCDEINNSHAGLDNGLMTGVVWNSNASPDDREFGEFASSPAVLSKQYVGQEFVFPHIKDNISIAESQSVSSLELGIIDGGGHSGESKSSLSRQGSIPSLDLKVAGIEAPDSEDGFGEMQSAATLTPISKTPSPSIEISKPTNERNQMNTLSGFPFQQTSTLPLIDKYSIIRSEQVKEDEHIYDWSRCIQSCLDILSSATRNFNQMSCSSVCNEVLNSEEGSNFVKNVIEVYKVTCRIALVSKSMGKQAESLLHLLEAVDHAWNTLTVFLTGSSIMPDDSALDFTSGVLRADPENNLKACGLCLLNVDARTKAFNRSEDTQKLTYGGRQYHSTCANLWVNCVDPLLPTLTLPQLL